MKALVTGGGGFLGGAVVRRLVDRGYSVRSLQRGLYPQLDALGVEQIRGDIADPKVVGRAVEGCTIVFHVAAKVDPWGTFEPFRRTNVVGTENVLAAMRRHGVPKLVFTSTPSVVHRGGDLAGVDESEPYPEHFDAAYPQISRGLSATVDRVSSLAAKTAISAIALVWG